MSVPTWTKLSVMGHPCLFIILHTYMQRWYRRSLPPVEMEEFKEVQGGLNQFPVHTLLSSLGCIFSEGGILEEDGWLESETGK